MEIGFEGLIGAIGQHVSWPNIQVVHNVEARGIVGVGGMMAADPMLDVT